MTDYPNGDLSPRIAKFKCSRCGEPFTPVNCKCENECEKCRTSPFRRFPISEATNGA